MTQDTHDANTPNSPEPYKIQLFLQILIRESMFLLLEFLHETSVSRTLQGVSNELPHTTYRVPWGTPWRVLVNQF